MTAVLPALLGFRLVCARVCTAEGGGAYCRSVPSFWPSALTSHLKSITTALPFVASERDGRIMTQLKPAIGQVGAPGPLVIEKLLGLTLVVCAGGPGAPRPLPLPSLPSAVRCASRC